MTLPKYAKEIDSGNIYEWTKITRERKGECITIIYNGVPTTFDLKYFTLTVEEPNKKSDCCHRCHCHSAEDCPPQEH